MPGDFGLGHAGVMFQRQRGDGRIGFVVTADPGETDDGADILAAAGQGCDFPGDIEIGLLDPNGQGALMMVAIAVGA